MGNTLRIREHIGNLMRTHWELEGTCLEQRKNEKTAPCAAPPPPPPPPNQTLEISNLKIESRSLNPNLTSPE